jgi:hypothetical protein
MGGVTAEEQAAATRPLVHLGHVDASADRSASPAAGRYADDTATGTGVDTPVPGLLWGRCHRPSLTVDRADSRAFTEAVVP